MNKIDNFKNKLRKHPTVLKRVLSYNDTEKQPEKVLMHFAQLFLIKQKKYGAIKLAIHDYQSFKSLYKALLLIVDEKEVYCTFYDFTHDQKINFLEKNNIKYEVVDQYLYMYPQNYKESSMLSSPHWCIKKSENMWGMYNKYREQYIVCNKKTNDVIGISFDKKDNYCVFNYKNENIKSKLDNSIKKHLNLNFSNNVENIDNNPRWYDVWNFLSMTLSAVIISIFILMSHGEVLFGIFVFFAIIFFSIFIIMDNNKKFLSVFIIPLCCAFIVPNNFDRVVFNKEIIKKFNYFSIINPITIKNPLDDEKVTNWLKTDDIEEFKNYVEENKDRYFLGFQEKHYTILIDNKSFNILEFWLSNKSTIGYTNFFIRKIIENDYNQKLIDIVEKGLNVSITEYFEFDDTLYKEYYDGLMKK
jgi:hypothetical protein